MPPWPAGRWRATAACALDVIVGEEVTTLGGHLLALFIERPIRPVPLAAHDRSPTSTTPAAWRSRPIRSSPTRCAPRAGCCGACSTTRTRPSIPTRSRPSTRPRSGGRGTTGSCASPTRHGLARGRQQRRARARRDRRRLDDVRGPRPPRTCGRAIEAGTTGHGGAFHGTAGQVGVFGRQLRKRARDARDEVARARPARRHRPRPWLSRRPRPAAALRSAGQRDEAGREDRPGLPVHLPGATAGVAQHVRFLYENLRLRGHDVRILTASHGPQRSSEGDIIRLGVGFSVPINASVGTLTFSPRYLSQIGAMLERERFDVLHFHEPFVPFLSLFLLRESKSVNVATFHAYAGFSPSYEFGSRALQRLRAAAARPDRGQRGGPPLHRPLLPGRLQGHPQRRRRRAGSPTRSRSRAGRTARPNVLFVGRHEPRKGLIDLLKAHRILRKTRLRPAPARRRQRARRSARRGATSRRAACRASSSSAASSDAEKAQLFRTADVYASPATGGESFGIVLLEAMAAGHADRVLGHPRLQGRRPARPRGPARSAARAARAGRRHRPRCCATRRCASEMGAAGQERAEAVQLAAGHGQGRRLLRLRHPPPGGRRQPAGRASAPRCLRRRRRSGPGRPARVSGAGSPAARPRPPATPRARAARPRPSRRRRGRSR